MRSYQKLMFMFIDVELTNNVSQEIRTNVQKKKKKKNFLKEACWIKMASSF